jgi:hypothetical protein
MASFTTRELSKVLLKHLRGGTVAEGNKVARIGAILLANKQLELSERAHGVSEPVVLIEDDSEAEAAALPNVRRIGG